MYQYTQNNSRKDTSCENAFLFSGETFRFTSKELDTETGFIYYKFRYYDPRLGRWESADRILAQYLPLGDKEKDKSLPGMGGVFNTINIDLYHYAGDNPVRYTDPDGNQDFFSQMESWCDTKNQEMAGYDNDHPNQNGLVSGMLGMVDGWFGISVFHGADGSGVINPYITDASKEMSKKNYDIGKKFTGTLSKINAAAGGVKLLAKGKGMIGKASDFFKGLLGEAKIETSIPAKIESVQELVGKGAGNEIKEMVNKKIEKNK